MVPGSIFCGVTGFFSDIFPSDRTMDLGVDSAPSENEYQEHFLGVKTAGAWDWQPHHLHVPNVVKSVSLNLLEPSGPHRACYGTAFIKTDEVVSISANYGYFFGALPLQGFSIMYASNGDASDAHSYRVIFAVTCLLLWLNQTAQSAWLCR